MRELIGFCLVCVLLCLGVWKRRWLGLKTDYGFFLKLIPIVTAGGSTIVGVLYPFVYALVMRAIYGGTLIDNLPPGVGEEALFGNYAASSSARPRACCRSR